MLASILSKSGEIKPTHLMYKSNLSHSQLRSYLDDLIEKEFVKNIRKDKYEYIIITDKGCNFLEKLREMKRFEDTFGL